MSSHVVNAVHTSIIPTRSSGCVIPCDTRRVFVVGDGTMFRGHAVDEPHIHYSRHT